MRRRKQQLDSGSERRVAVSVDADSQELIIAGPEGDVEQVAGELEYAFNVSSNFLSRLTGYSR